MYSYVCVYRCKTEDEGGEKEPVVMAVGWVDRKEASSVVYSAGCWEVQLVAHLAEYLADLTDALSATRN